MMASLSKTLLYVQRSNALRCTTSKGQQRLIATSTSKSNTTMTNHDPATVSKEHLERKKMRNSDDLRLSMSRPLRGFPHVEYASVEGSNDESLATRTTVLSNGLTVATQPVFGSFCTVGVLVNSGSRHEILYPGGTNLFLERLAYTGSSMLNSKDDVLQRMEAMNGICDCQSSRDVTIYAASVNGEKVEGLVEMLADVVFQPTLASENIQLARQGIQYEMEDINLRPDAEPLMTETVHAAAFRGNTLGLGRYPQPESIDKIDKTLLETYLRSYYHPSRMVLAGVGVDHDFLCKIADQYFTDAAKSPSWGLEGKTLRDDSVSQYTGGEIRIEKECDLSMSVVPMPDLAHVSVGLQSCDFTHSDFVPFAVVNMLMGGGGSFSAGGPGKGMFSRLYLNVLNRYHWMYAATAFHHTYEDGGFFCIQASAAPNRLQDCVDVIAQEFVKLTGGVGKIELNRAKKQLQSMLMMNLEARPVIFEDVGRQILATGTRKSPQELCDMIEKVSNEDVVRIAQKMIKSKPCMSAVGNLTNLPPLSYVEKQLTTLTPRNFIDRFRLFSR